MEKRETDVLVIGDLNVDLIMNKINKTPQIGQEQLAKEMNLTMGGSTAIFACNIAKLGSNVDFVSKLGDDIFGKFLLDELTANNVGVDSIITDNSLRTGVTIIFFIDDDRMMVTYPGSMEHLSIDDISNEVLQSSRHLHTSAIFFQPLLKKRLPQLFDRAKKIGVSTSLDTQWDPNEAWDIDLEKILPNLDFFLPNEDEFIQLTNKPDINTALKSLDHHETCFVIKRGEKGVVMSHKGNRTELKSLPIPKIVDTIGAGDSFNAGFIHAYLKGLHLNECLKFGNKTAAISTTEPGGITAIKSYQQVLERTKSFKN